MARLTNESDQFGVEFEFLGAIREDWVTARIALERYIENSNLFHAFVEAIVDIYKTDLRELQKQLNSVNEDREGWTKVRFEPLAEPSFELAFVRMPGAKAHGFSVKVAVDLKRVENITVPAGYRENRVTLEFLTDQRRLRGFVEGVLRDIGKVLTTRRG
jgi:hypothetical protein